MIEPIDGAQTLPSILMSKFNLIYAIFLVPT
jgi:hypothetical protein